MLCGHCNTSHDSVAEVKACSRSAVSSPDNGSTRHKLVHLSNDDSDGRWLPRNSTGRGYGSKMQDERAARKTSWANSNTSKLMTPAELSSWLEDNKFQ